jgi:uncharacterized membrane protein
LTALAALLRFSTLGVQNFWPDEAVTAALVDQDLGGMLSVIPHSESTPPLYYLLAWLWSRAFGTGEVGLRALSALFGTLTIPMVYAAGARLVSKRVALYATLLAAVSPALVWYSQEARAYALLFLLCATSLWLFARAVEEPRGWTLTAWAATCVAALYTHYFAAFFVGAEAVALLVLGRERRWILLALGAMAAAAVCLLPIALQQASQGNADWIAQVPLRTRTADVGGMFLAGETADYFDYAVPSLAALSAAAACLLLWSDRPGERNRALLVGGIAIAAVLLPLALDAAGSHYVLGRNLLPLWLPLALVVAAGVVGARLRAAAVLIGSALVLGSLVTTIAVPMDRDLQRERITADLAGLPVDVDHARLASRVKFAEGDEARPVQSLPPCPGGYSTASNDARRLSDGSDGVIMTSVVCVEAP